MRHGAEFGCIHVTIQDMGQNLAVFM